MLTGPDCSHHQGSVDWPRVRTAGHSFAIIKATDSVAYSWTSWFMTHAPRVEAAGLVLGCYHFLSDQHDGAAQARFYVDTVRKAGGFDGRLAVLDVETGPGGKPGSAGCGSSPPSSAAWCPDTSS
jgi:lysozyme